MQDRQVTDWLPTTKKEMELRGWDSLDVIVVSGDAYVDHPAFGVGVLGRLLESEGLRVAILPQPNWTDDLRDFKKLGKPNLFFGVTAGCMDSMVNHYTAAKRKRSDDAYTPGGISGFRPDYATTVYSKIPNGTKDVWVVSQLGDRLDSLAHQFYGDVSLWWYIANANHIKVMKLKVGTLLRIPADIKYAKGR